MSSQYLTAVISHKANKQNCSPDLIRAKPTAISPLEN